MMSIKSLPVPTTVFIVRGFAIKRKSIISSAFQNLKVKKMYF